MTIYMVCHDARWTLDCFEHSTCVFYTTQDPSTMADYTNKSRSSSPASSIHASDNMTKSTSDSKGSKRKGELADRHGPNQQY